MAPDAAPSAPLATPGRLKQRADFLRLAKSGRKAVAHGLVLQAMAQSGAQSGAQDGAQLGPPRLGFTVTKKVGNAVIRNRTRRRLKEAARLLLRDEPVLGYDLVLIGRESTRGRPFPVLVDDLRRALQKVGAL